MKYNEQKTVFITNLFRSIFSILAINLFTVSVLLTSHSVYAQESSSSATMRAKTLGIPTLDEMAGEWIPFADIVNPPSLHNGHNMLIVDRDLTSYFFSPDGWLYNLAAYADAKEPSVWRRGYPAVKLFIDDKEYMAQEARQGSYRTLRRNLACNGLAVETDTRMVDEQRGVLSQITFTNTTLLPRNFRVKLRMPGSLQPDHVGVANEFQRAGVISIIRPTRKPDKVDIDAYIVVDWTWNITLSPGESCHLGFAAGDEPTTIGKTDGFIQGDIGNQKGNKVDARVADWANDFDKAFAEIKETRENRWADAFTPGNRHFSGHLPVLKTEDLALKRNYYMGAFTILSLERTQFALYSKSFVTNGERDDGTQFYGDIAVEPTVWALLEPGNMKATLRRWLVQNPRNSAWLDLRQTKGYDSKQYDRMYGYSSNACNFLWVADAYLRITGDTSFLDEKLENGKTVLECMDAMATDWETLPKGPFGLVDYGGNECLLECIPAYAHCVASINAQVVWTLRNIAKWQALKGNPARAKSLRGKADAFLPKVMRLYKPGDGVWYSYQPDGKKLTQRHAMDYIYAGMALTQDLNPVQKNEMNAFVKRELFARDWMRAMSLSDESATTTRRADHGPNGSYDVWPALTIRTMWRLGDPTAAFDFYRRIAIVTREGSFTQAHEFYGPNWEKFDAPVRISSDRGNMREALGGATFTDLVINTFFGFDPGSLGPEILIDPKIPRPFKAELLNINFSGKQLSLQANEKGIKTINKVE
ncbi:hypothetical protein [Pedobacter nutrimenti]|uniref:hypothetical protein n=1 Tax=Pedobacter nutrimenti TaxID=1241337 RepID=UPI002931A0CE|nr:hypothetical protein [Pedobacter nutrimenti]